MLRQEMSQRTESVLNAISFGSVLIAAFVGAMLKVDKAQWSGVAYDILNTSQTWAWLIIPGFTILGAVAQYIRNQIGSRYAWRITQYLLDEYWKEIFGKNTLVKDQAKYEYRVTLFKHVNRRWFIVRWPGAGWMVPVARSGDKGKARIACYRAPRHRPARAEGIAGQTWAQERTLIVSELPDVREGNVTEAQYREYASKTFLSLKRVRKEKPSARSLIGIHIEVKSKSWGAVVVDSRHPEPIATKRVLKGPRFKMLNAVMSKLHE